MISTVTRLQAAQCPLYFSAETGDFNLFQNIQTSSEAHPAACSMRTGSSFLEVQQLRHAATHIHALLTLGMGAVIHLLLLDAFMACAGTFFNDSLFKKIFCLRPIVSPRL